MSQFIKTKSVDGIFHIELSRLSAKNAISLDMYQYMVDELARFESDTSLKVAVVYGDSTCFTAGNDLADFLAGGELNEEHSTVKFLYSIANLKKPIIAAVAGPAIGIGTTMLLHCDMVFSADNAVFQLPFAQLGLCPEAASSLLLAQQLGHQKAFELLVVGNRFDAETAENCGFVNHIEAADSVIEKAIEYAKLIGRLSPDAVLSSKALLKNANKQQVEDTIKLELEHFGKLLNSEECKTIIAQFFKR